jgi:hypothetical protein
MEVLVHATLHVRALPVIWSCVQALPSSQAAGHEVAGSQVSPASTMPLPQVAPGVGPLPVAESAPLPVAPPLVVPPASVPAEAPPLPDRPESDVPHDVIVAAILSTVTANEVFFISDSP